MKTNAKKTVMAVGLAVVCSLIIPRAAAAAGPITIQGTVYDATNKPVVGTTVVSWCGGVNFFGGADATDTNGHYLIQTDSDKCPFDNELTVTTDTNGDGLSDGAVHTQAHTSTTISIHLGQYNSVAVPEYGWVGASAATLAGVAIVGFVRRDRLARHG